MVCSVVSIGFCVFVMGPTVTLLPTYGCSTDECWIIELGVLSRPKWLDFFILVAGVFKHIFILFLALNPIPIYGILSPVPIHVICIIVPMVT